MSPLTDLPKQHPPGRRRAGPEAGPIRTRKPPGERRRLSGPWRWLLPVWATVTLLLCFNQQFTLRFFIDFTMLDTEYYWLLVSLLVPAAFVIYPARRGLHVDHVPGTTSCSS